MRLPRVVSVCVIFAWLAIASTIASAAPVTRDEILAEADKVADAQLRANDAKVAIDWVWAVMDVGAADYSHVSPKGAAYGQALLDISNSVQWTPRFSTSRPFNADDFTIGQTFLDLYASHPDSGPARLDVLKNRLDTLVEHINAPVENGKITFYWCDALFMAPPVMTRMSAITHDPKYIDAMDKEFWRCTELLYNRDEHLFYRDARFLNKTNSHGKKILWSRGNGWVLAGLAHILRDMPADYPQRPKYVALFKEMAAKIVTLQSSDGTWHTNLADPAEFGGPETSGTSLHTFALAWGINNKLLDRETYLPVIAKAWSAMLADRRPDGLPGYAQPVGSKPQPAKPESTQPFATGGYLLAASQLAELAPFELPTAAVVTAAPAPAAFARYVPERMDDIAWENDRIAHRIYGPALQHNPREHSGSGIDVWVKKVREPIIDEWYSSGQYHADRGTGLDFYEVGTSRGDGGLGIWDNGKLYISKDWVEQKMLDLGPNACGFNISYDPWDANGRKVREHRTMTLAAGSNLTRIQSVIDSDRAGEIIIGIGLCKRPGNGGKLLKDEKAGVMSYWQPPEKDGTIGVGVKVDPATIVGFVEDDLNYLVLVNAAAGKPFVYYAGACWDKGLDFHSSEQWEKYLLDFAADDRAPFAPATTREAAAR